MNNQEMQNMMMEHMHRHHEAMYTFGILVIVGLAIIIVLMALTLKEIRKRRG